MHLMSDSEQRAALTSTGAQLHHFHSTEEQLLYSSALVFEFAGIQIPSNLVGTGGSGLVLLQHFVFKIFLGKSEGTS